MDQNEPQGDPQTNALGKMVIFLWCLLLIPWLPFAGLSGMAFDGGKTFKAYLFLYSMLTYPVSVILAAALYKRVPALLGLPAINIIGVMLAD